MPENLSKIILMDQQWTIKVPPHSAADKLLLLLHNLTVIPFDIPAIAGTDKFAVWISLKLPANSGYFLVKFFSSVENLLN